MECRYTFEMAAFANQFSVIGRMLAETYKAFGACQGLHLYSLSSRITRATL
jgi:hypothetical protein